MINNKFQIKISKKLTLVVTIFTVLLTFLVIFSLRLGQVNTSNSEIINNLLNHLGMLFRKKPADDINSNTTYILWQIRLPRTCLAIVIGAALGIAGALLQGSLGNPLADPGIVGVSAGATVGACAAITLGETTGVIGAIFSNSWIQILMAFISGVLAVLTVIFGIWKLKYNAALNTILIGIAINAFAGGIISFLTSSASNLAKNKIIFWQMGSLATANWHQVYLIFTITVFGLIISQKLSNKIDLLALGDTTANNLGVNAIRLRVKILILVTLLTAGAVSISGLIIFVGLIIPHIVRLIIGAKNVYLIPLSALVGSNFLLLSDILCRNLIANAELPIGMFTSLIGGPTFLYLLTTKNRRPSQ